MKNITVNFTDAYGLTHVDAVVEVSYATKSLTQYESIGMSVTSQTTVNVSMQYRYWHSAAAKEAGMMPIVFTAKGSMQNSFSTNPTSLEEVVDLEDYCLAYFRDTLLVNEGGYCLGELVLVEA
jgi:hypothetical protein